MMITSRPFENDYNNIMDFLREIYFETRTQKCWLPQRWEYAEHFVNHLYIERGWDDWEKYIHIWEENDKIVAVCHKESETDVFLQIRPKYEYLAQEMLDFAENMIAIKGENGKKHLTVWSTESNKYLNDALTERGYSRGDDGSYFNVQKLNSEYIPNLSSGYRFVNANEIINPKERNQTVHRGFHPDDKPLDVVTNSFLMMERAPLFKAELELMTQYKDGTLTSFCCIWYDEKTQTGMFEPVCTHINHRRKGLGREMIIEGLRLLKEIGATHAYVASYGDERKAFYNSAGFVTFDKDRYWTKEI